jgi:hypothetical protein
MVSVVGEVTVTTPPRPASREESFPLQFMRWFVASCAIAWVKKLEIATRARMVLELRNMLVVFVVGYKDVLK